MTSALSRREFLKGTGVLVVGFSIGGARMLEGFTNVHAPQ
jgi:hypothetical protein